MQSQTFDLEDSLGYLVGTAARSMMHRLNRNFSAAGFDITVEHWHILVNLWERDGQHQQQLAENSCRDKTSITRILDTLEDRNFVVRVPDKKDRRHKQVFLTKAGKKLQDQLIPVAQKTLTEAQEGIPSKQLNLCKDVLRKVFQNLDT